MSTLVTLKPMYFSQFLFFLNYVEQEKTCIIEGSVDGNPGRISHYPISNTFSILTDQERDVPVFEIVENTSQLFLDNKYYQKSLLFINSNYGNPLNPHVVVSVVEEPYAVVIVSALMKDVDYAKV